MDQNNLSNALTTPDVSRRAIVKAAAWSVPVVALAVATPAAAQSAVDPFYFTMGVMGPRPEYVAAFTLGCRMIGAGSTPWPNGSTWVVTLSWENNQVGTFGITELDGGELLSQSPTELVVKLDDARWGAYCFADVAGGTVTISGIVTWPGGTQAALTGVPRLEFVGAP